MTRRRSEKATAFQAILQNAQKKTFAFLEMKRQDDVSAVFRIIDDENRDLQVTIRESPHCTVCNDRNVHQKTRQTCVHIVWCLINQLNVSMNSSLLAQVSLTQNELRNLLKVESPEEKENIPEGNDHPDATESSYARFTAAELESIFEGNSSNTKSQTWYANKLVVRKDAKCCTCRSTMPAGKIYVYVNGLYVPPNQNFSTNRTFYFCAQPSCLAKKPFMSNIKVPPKEVTNPNDSNLLISDINIMKNRNINIV